MKTPRSPKRKRRQYSTPPHMGPKISMPKRNIERAYWAKEACASFGREVGMSVENDLSSIIGDLIGNIMHLSDMEGLDFEQRLAVGREHHRAETVCCGCKVWLKAGDDSGNLDNVCKKCERNV